ncbi:glycosyltransferase [Aquipseudomonas campi]|uniref:Glycosyltransferase n=1 Tax=Aquipseudomonas campi TaxID=2731681 RepID=A0A6M8FGT5_9GAMM|nr:glycosyltransferase [Pseudomonas campi]QKE65463.1 glycosyltransferase [Pseudomonas campi]
MSFFEAEVARVHGESVWHPPVDFFEPRKRKPNSSLNMAAVVGEKLYQGLRYEGRLHVALPGTWRDILDFAEVDFLIIESFFVSCTGHWKYGQTNEGAARTDLEKLLSYSRERGIPSAYWITHGVEYFNAFLAFSRLFDYVFCADPEMVDLLAASGVEARVLLPAVQPAVHNPLRQTEAEPFSIGVLVDQVSLIYKSTTGAEALHDLGEHGYKSIDLGSVSASSHLGRDKHFLGTVSPEALLEVIKRTSVYVTCESSAESPTSQQWRSLQAVACKSLVMHYGNLGESDIRQGLVQSCKDREELLVALAAFEQDDLYRRRLCHKVWRTVYSEHTFSHRMRDLARVLGIRHDWVESQKITVVMPTCRRELLSVALDNFEKQLYGNKELVVVMNWPGASNSSFPAKAGVRALVMPFEKSAAACLNFGIEQATGKYCVRMDDDDLYGEYFLSDIALSLNAVDAVVFGKPPAFVCFESDGAIYSRAVTLPDTLVGKDDVLSGSRWLAGNSLGGDVGFFKEHPYPEFFLNAADTGFLKNAALYVDDFFVFDAFNSVACRRVDASSHTWKIAEVELRKKGARLVGVAVSDLFV